MIKKLITIFLSLLMIVTMVGCSSSKNEEEKDLLATIKDRGYIVVAMEGEWSPWTYYDETTGELTGFEVDMANRIAEIIGVEAKFEVVEWTSILAGVESGRFDIACNGVGYTEERAQSYSFSEPYYGSTKVLIVKDDNEDIKTWTDLNGKTTTNSLGSTYATVAEEYGATVVYVDTIDQTIEVLLRGDADATINSRESFDDYMSVKPDTPVKVVAENAGEVCAYPMPKGDNSATLVAAVNDAIEQMKASGELSELSIKWFGEDKTQNLDLD